MKALGVTAENLLVSSQEVEGKQDLCFISSKVTIIPQIHLVLGLCVQEVRTSFVQVSHFEQ